MNYFTLVTINYFTLVTIDYFTLVNIDYFTGITVTMRLSNGATVNDVAGEEADQIKRVFAGHKDGFVRVNPGGYFFPSHYKTWAQDYLDFKVIRFHEKDYSKNNKPISYYE